MSGWSIDEFLNNKTPLCDSVMVDTCHYAFSKPVLYNVQYQEEIQM